MVVHGFSVDVSLKEFEGWLDSPTRYPDIRRDELLRRPLLVAHEIAEIAELKKEGLQITSDLMMKEPDRVYDAHLKAFEAELALAKETREWDHIELKSNDVRNWVEDPQLPPRLKPKCDELLAKTKDAVKEHRSHT